MNTESNILTLSNGMQFMHVPAGPFLMGKKDDNRPPFGDFKLLHTVDISYDFWMGRYPVTNELYNAYLKSLGIEDPDDGWEEEKKNHPVVWVPWGKAIAYCQWLNNLHKEELPSGLILRLPTEAEWEKTARGTDGREYPWGNVFDAKNCNTRDSASSGFDGKTTRVGLYSPQGDSPYGCADMAGNVWEWTHSLQKPYPYDVNDGREDETADGTRILRGGSYNNGGNFAFCANRIEQLDLRFSGFRVVISVGLP